VAGAVGDVLVQVPSSTHQIAGAKTAAIKIVSGRGASTTHSLLLPANDAYIVLPAASQHITTQHDCHDMTLLMHTICWDRVSVGQAHATLNKAVAIVYECSKSTFGLSWSSSTSLLRTIVKDNEAGLW